MKPGKNVHDHPVEIIAHRGASFDVPENTLAAVRLAWSQKADAVEVDVYLSKDGRIVVIHDPDTKQMAGVDRPVAEQTLAELQSLDVGRWKGAAWAGEKIPTLAQVLELLPEGKGMFLDIKSGPEIIPELRRVVAESGKPSEHIAVIGPLDVCTAIKKALPKHPAYFLEEFRWDEKTGQWSPSAGDLVAAVRKAGLDGLDLGLKLPLDRSFIQSVKEADLKVYVWTVDDPGDARRLAEGGIDGITTNRPEFLRRQIAGSSK